MIIRFTLLFVVFFANNALAKPIQEKMKDWLNDVGVNGEVNPMGGNVLQGAGYLTGGSGKIRFPVSQIELGANVTMPSFSAGCGGIDFNLGGIELLKLDNVKKQLQQISGGLVPVAIMLGMQTLTPSLTSVMQEFQEKADRFSKMSIDTCEASALLIQGGLAAAGKREAACISYQVNTGKKDFASAREACHGLDGKVEINQTAEERDNSGEFTKGNLTWYLLLKSGLFKQNAADIEGMEVLMNLLGTVIFREMPSDEKAPGNFGSEGSIAPLLNLSSDKFEQVMTNYIGLPGAQVGRAAEMPFQRCSNKSRVWDPYACTELAAPVNLDVKSDATYEKVYEAMVGMLANIRSDKAFEEWSPLQKLIVSESDIPIYRYLVVLQAYSPGLSATADIEIKKFATLYSKMVFLRNLNAVASTLAQTLGQNNLKGAHIEKYADGLLDLIKGVNQQMAKNSELLNNYEELVNRIAHFDKILANRVGSSLLQSPLYKSFDK